MEFFSNKNIEDYNDYCINLETIKGIYFDNLPAMKLVYVIEGSVEYSFDTEKYLAKKGDIIFINSLQNKFLISQDPANLCLILTIKDDYLKDLGQLYYNAEFYNLIEKDYVLDEVINNLIYLYKLSNSQGDLDQENRQLILKKLLKYFIKYYSKKEGGSGSLHENLDYFDLIDKISDSESIKDMNLGYIANHAHLSPSYTSRLFNEVVGMKLVEYLQKLRLYYASVYLLNSKLTIEEICHQVGFGYAKSLNRIFHKYLDISPNQYRKFYQSEASQSSQEVWLEALLKNQRNVDYGDFIASHSQELEIDIDLGLPRESGRVFKNLSILRNLNSLGENYLEKLEKEKDNIGLREILLRFSFDGDRLYLTDLNREISIKELYKLLEFCIRNKIRALIYLVDISLDYNLDNIEKNLEIYGRFNDIISNGIGSNNMNKLAYIIDISEMTLFYKDPEKFTRYRDYIRAQQVLLEEKTSNDKFQWGYELGLVDDKKLDIFKSIYENYKSNRSSKPLFISLKVDLPDISLVDSVDEIGRNDRKIAKLLDKFRRLKEEVSFPTSNVYVRGVFSHIDISYVDQRYKDLLISSLMMRRGLVLRDDIKLVTDFLVKDSTYENQLYYPRITDEYGFYTPVYWLLNMLEKIDGEIIHVGENYLVAQNLKDIYIIIYGNYLLSYIYANKKGYDDLDESKFKLDLNIRGISGKYKVTTEKLSFKYGNILYNLGSFDNYKYLTLQERDHLKKVSIPKFNMEIKNFDGVARDSLEYSPFNIILRKYIKI